MHTYGKFMNVTQLGINNNNSKNKKITVKKSYVNTVSLSKYLFVLSSPSSCGDGRWQMLCDEVNDIIGTAM